MIGKQMNETTSQYGGKKITNHRIVARKTVRKQRPTVSDYRSLLKNIHEAKCNRDNIPNGMNHVPNEEREVE